MTAPKGQRQCGICGNHPAHPAHKKPTKSHPNRHPWAHRYVKGGNSLPPQGVHDYSGIELEVGQNLWLGERSHPFDLTHDLEQSDKQDMGDYEDGDPLIALEVA